MNRKIARDESIAPYVAHLRCTWRESANWKSWRPASGKMDGVFNEKATGHGARGIPKQHKQVQTHDMKATSRVREEKLPRLEKANGEKTHTHTKLNSLRL